jgi:iron donor protein CyaY
MDDQEFQTRADKSLQGLYKRLAAVSDEAEFDVDFHDGALTIEFDAPPVKFVVSPNAPVRQIWISAQSKSYKLDWDEVENTFVLQGTSQTITELIQDVVAKQLGEEVTL